jgi:UDPglucose 6-dehydrogenase
MLVARLRIGVVGLGKLGMPYAETLAEFYDVVGYDVEKKTSDKFEIVENVQEFLGRCEFLFIVLPTPHETGYDGSKPTGNLPPKEFSYDAIRQFLPLACEFNFPIVLVSTVLPGSCRRYFAPIAQNSELLYLPAFAAMGEIRSGLINPDVVILGTRTGSLREPSPILEVLGTLTNHSTIQVMTWEEAESVKVFYNTFIGLKLMFVNTIQDVAMRIGNANVDVITQALLESKGRVMSPAYMRAGMGDGGPCHPRDNIAMRELSHRLGLGYDIFSAVIKSREAQTRNIARYAAQYDMEVVLIGKSYKAGVLIEDGSCSILLAEYLNEMGLFAGFFEDIGQLAFSGPKTFILTHERESFHALSFYVGSVIIDPWRRCPSIAGCTVKHYGDSRVQELVV